ncbi:MAG: sigma-54-dependent Fis family transcriptional regulator [Deltaproteobacteria bacterium]|nr:sigma-54-dependent Fis family transcriptional regulator [Deltaproteobacteria bacterium]
MTQLERKGKILITDDEPNALKVLSAILSEEGYQVLSAQDVDRAIEIIQGEEIDAIVTDLRMPGKSGMQFLEYVTEKYSDIPLIFLTAYGTVESAVHAVTRGAFYYFIKPPDYIKLKSILARAVEQRLLKREIDTLKKTISNGQALPFVVGNTTQMRKIAETIETIKDSSSSVLICGETGTGKELIAKTLHFSSIRKNKPFVAVNCAAIPRDLLESELFGCEKGAFTGAVARRIGKVEESEGGTLFLDEIGELDLSLQAKLLRVLQEREFERLGSNKKIKVDFRLVSSVNHDLKKAVEAGTFRRDLFYRLNVVQINVPPLRERKADFPVLVSQFLKEFCLREKKILKVSDEVMSIFENYLWPGNIRQLKNVIERAVVLAKESPVTPGELPEELAAVPAEKQQDASQKTLRQMELQVIKDTLENCGGNKSKAAKLLGISRKAFYKRLKELNFS